jgi:hypothetical protein
LAVDSAILTSFPVLTSYENLPLALTKASKLGRFVRSYKVFKASLTLVLVSLLIGSVKQ